MYSALLTFKRTLEFDLVSGADPVTARSAPLPVSKVNNEDSPGGVIVGELKVLCSSVVETS